jgi:predicted TIM-barrel enzyme
VTDSRPCTRAQILARLRQSLDEGRPIIGAGSNSGLIAKSDEIAALKAQPLRALARS